MPKQVDHAQRREEIAAALWRIAARDGLEAASLAGVASEAGVSKGRVQHYFASRQDMLAFAAATLHERIDRRIRSHLEGAGSPVATVRAVLTGLLPLDDDARTDALVGSAFFVRAINDPASRERLRRGEEDILTGLTDGLAAARAAGELRTDLDPAREADLLLALVGGLADAMLVGRHTPTSAVTTLDHQLARLRSRTSRSAGRRPG